MRGRRVEERVEDSKFGRSRKNMVQVPRTGSGEPAHPPKQHDADAKKIVIECIDNRIATTESGVCQQISA